MSPVTSQKDAFRECTTRALRDGNQQKAMGKARGGFIEKSLDALSSLADLD